MIISSPAGNLFFSRFRFLILKKSALPFKGDLEIEKLAPCEWHASGGSRAPGRECPHDARPVVSLALNHPRGQFAAMRDSPAFRCRVVPIPTQSAFGAMPGTVTIDAGRATLRHIGICHDNSPSLNFNSNWAPAADFGFLAP
jgi:hypothetical protein